jgi:CO dehydrogenase maturation factor
MIVSVSGKGGVGKTAIMAMLIDELVRFNYPGRILAVDGDPAMTLHLALGLPEPPATVAEVRDAIKLGARSIRALPAGTGPGRHVLEQLRQAQVVTRRQLRKMYLDFMAMGPGEGPGCYCSVNGALKQALAAITGSYDLVMLDNEAGMEYLSRYRIGRADMFLVVVTPDRASQEVADRIIRKAGQMEIELGQTWLIYNRMINGFKHVFVPRYQNGHQTVTVPYTWGISHLELSDQVAVVNLALNDPMRAALHPITEQILACA